MSFSSYDPNLQAAVNTHHEWLVSLARPRPGRRSQHRGAALVQRLHRAPKTTLATRTV